MGQTWDPAAYARNARFVTELGAGVLELLAARPGERILDLGCGDGVLTRKIVDQGCTVVGIDSSRPFVLAARSLGLDAREMDASTMDFAREFDAVFSNAALHWMKDAHAVIGRVADALRAQGRFVAEMGGHGNVETIHSALIEELEALGYNARDASPWYLPTAEEYRVRLSKAGFDVRSISLFPRPTRLPGDMLDWLRTFAGPFTALLPPSGEREQYLRRVRERVRPHLCDATGHWTADYVRLRFEAHLTD